MTEPLDRLHAVLDDLPLPIAIAVSGGVDSLTLAAVAHARLGEAARMHHAISPAVPAAATDRTRDLAGLHGWTLAVFDAGEFDDPSYRANPVDRCFYCKTSLYGAVARHAGPDATILSGTNTDDLGEYRPGLDAARQHGVRHPFVEAGIDKAGVRALARSIGLGDVAELPSSPCLSSRVETGIAIDPATLATIERVETMIRITLRPRTVRCRVRSRGFVIELDPETLAAVQNGDHTALNEDLRAATGQAPVFAPYRNGSAFLRAESAA